MASSPRSAFALFLTSAVAAALHAGAATAAAQPYVASKIYGEFGQVYREDSRRMPAPADGSCDTSRGQTCPNDANALRGRLNTPQDVAVGPAGEIVVADTFNHRVQVFDAAGAHRLTFGGLGSRGVPSCATPTYGCVPLIPGYPGETASGEPRLFFPSGVAVDALGHIVVADTWNHRVIVYRPDGWARMILGDYGDVRPPAAVTDSLGRFFYPADVAVSPGTRLGDPTDATGRLYVVDQDNQRIQVFDALLRPVLAFGARGATSNSAGTFEWPLAVAADPARGRVFVVDGNNHRVQVFGEDGTFRFLFGASDVDPGTGASTGVFDQPGHGLPGGLVVPLGVAVDPDGRVYVTDSHDRVRVYRQTATGVEHLFDIGAEGAAPGRFHNPMGLAWAGPGRIVVADTANERVQLFEPARLHIAALTASAARVPVGGAFEVRAVVRTDGDYMSEPVVELTLGSPGAAELEVATGAMPTGTPGEYEYRFHYRAAVPASFRITASATAGTSEPGVRVAAEPVGLDIRIVSADEEDDDPPRTTVALAVEPNGSGWTNRPQRVTFDATDEASGVDRIVVVFDSPRRDPVALAPGSTLPFSDGVWQLRYYAIDRAGNEEPSRTLTVRIDTAAPAVAFLRLTPAPNAAGWHRGEVTFQYVVTEFGSGVARRQLDGIGFTGEVVTIRGEGVGLRRRLTVTDHAGNSTSADTPAVNIDTTPPLVTCSGPAVVWPPNHRLVPVTMSVQTSDGMSGAAGFVLDSFASSEPDEGLGDGDAAGDLAEWAVNTPDVNGFVRAERSSVGRGRVYTFTYTGRDAAGNSASCAAAVTVPRAPI